MVVTILTPNPHVKLFLQTHPEENSSSCSLFHHDSVCSCLRLTSFSWFDRSMGYCRPIYAIGPVRKRSSAAATSFLFGLLLRWYSKPLHGKRTNQTQGHSDQSDLGQTPRAKEAANAAARRTASASPFSPLALAKAVPRSKSRRRGGASTAKSKAYFPEASPSPRLARATSTTTWRSRC